MSREEYFSPPLHHWFDDTILLSSPPTAKCRLEMVRLIESKLSTTLIWTTSQLQHSLRSATDPRFTHTGLTRCGESVGQEVCELDEVTPLTDLLEGYQNNQYNYGEISGAITRAKGLFSLPSFHGYGRPRTSD